MLDKIKLYFPILLLTAGHGAVDFYITLLQVVAPGLSEFLKIPLSDILILAGLAAIFSNIIQPIAGYVMGRRNLSWILWVSVIISALPTFMGFAGTYFVLFFLIILGSAGTGAYHPEGALAASDASGKYAYLGVPLFMAGGFAAVAAGTPLSIAISEKYGFPALAWLCVPGLLIGLVFLLQYHHRRVTHPSLVVRPRSKRVTPTEAGSMSYWPLLATAVFLMTGNGLFMGLLASHYELTFGPDSRVWAGWVLMVAGVVGSSCSFFWSMVTKRFGFYKVTALTQIMAAPLFILMAFPASPAWGLAISFPLGMVSPNSVYAVAVALSRNAAGLTQGLRTSIIIGGTSATAGAAVMVSGILLGRNVASSTLMLCAAGCSAVAVALSVWRLSLRRRGE